MANSSEKDEPSHWSGTFQRLRAETVILALILIASTQLELNLMKIPLLGVELGRPIPKGPILAFLYIFFVYFALAWYVRYRRERALLRHDREAVETLQGQITGQMEPLLGPQFPEGTEFLKTAEQVELELNRIAALGNSLLVDIKAGLQKDDERIEQMKALVSTALQEKLLERTDHLIEQTYSRSSISENMAQLANAVAGAGAMADTARSAVEAAADQVRRDIQFKGPFFNEAVKEVRAAMTIHLRRLRDIKSSIFYDLELLGFYVPLVFSLMLAFYSLPQGTKDMSPALGRLAGCIRSLNSPECWFRSGPVYSADDLLKSLPPDLVR